MVTERLTTIPLDYNVSKSIQVGDTLNVEVTVRTVFPHIKVLRTYHVMVVDRINELVECSLINERMV